MKNELSLVWWELLVEMVRQNIECAEYVYQQGIHLLASHILIAKMTCCFPNSEFVRTAKSDTTVISPHSPPPHGKDVGQAKSSLVNAFDRKALIASRLIRCFLLYGFIVSFSFESSISESSDHEVLNSLL